jgi:predicted short-subunit dehydrogenase-like oxidoreductase (DUF2520 family)
MVSARGRMLPATEIAYLGVMIHDGAVTFVCEGTDPGRAPPLHDPKHRPVSRMRELERNETHLPERPVCAVVGSGRVGSVLAAALPAAGCSLVGLLGRDAAPTGVDLVLLAVPDVEIAAAARHVPPGPLVGHLSGATGLDALAGHEGFLLHPLMTVLGAETSLAGAAAAVDGTTPRGRAAATELARRLGLRPVAVAAEDRVAYHAAASVASNFLVTLETAAERLAATAGLEREHLLPLVRAAVENWGTRGEAALTGPIARGDEATVARQRAAVAEREPGLLPLWDALAEATRALGRTAA